jgi:flagellar hook-length control protein FliK
MGEQPQVQPYENDEYEQDDFAHIMAGLLHKADEAQETEQTSEEVPVEFSDVKIDAAVLLGEAIDMEDNSELADMRGVSVNFVQDDSTEGADTEPAHGAEQAALISAQHLFGRTAQETETEETPEKTSADFADFDDADLLKDFAVKKETPSKTETEEVPALARLSEDAQAVLQNATAAAQEAGIGEKGKQKDRANGKENDKDILYTARRGEESLSANRANENDSRVLRAEDTKGRNRKDRLSVEVRDYRTQASGANANTSGAGAQINIGAQIEGSRVQAQPLNEITLELRLPETNSLGAAQNNAQSTWQLATSAETRASAAMENMLARELHQNFNGDIVRHASVALRDGGEGTIRIALKPEHLGNVKIHLELSENKITGQIIVESEEALNAFKKEVASLEQAFRESGFTSADLNLSLTQDQRNQGQQTPPSFVPRTVASRYDDSFEHTMPITMDVFAGQGHGSINMLA